MRPAMTSALPVDPVFQLILEAPRRKPVPVLPKRLTGLFRELSLAEPARPAEEIEDMIWALWTSHKERVAEETMAAAIEAMASGALQKARPLLDHLVATYPDWAEAWNKRATLAFIEKRDADALADIEQTLSREPRHFGAISGFGQICLRHGRMREARAAFQIALSINPHLEGLPEIVQELGILHRTLH